MGWRDIGARATHDLIIFFPEPADGEGAILLTGDLKRLIQADLLRLLGREEAIANASGQVALEQLKAQLARVKNAYAKYAETVSYYRTSALAQSNTLLQTSILSFKNGAISYIEWGASVGNAIQIRLQYIDALSNLITQRIEIEYLLTK